jgi:hypothetical protein
VSELLVDDFTSAWTGDSSGLWTVSSREEASHLGEDGKGLLIEGAGRRCRTSRRPPNAGSIRYQFSGIDGLPEAVLRWLGDTQLVSEDEGDEPNGPN